jgi:peptidoglycan/xylan/chitin deacetylase (PgdA/CDA1 family)
MIRARHLLTRTKRKLLAPMWRFYNRRPKPIILTYHRIAEAKTDPWRLAIPPREFDRQLAVLKQCRTVLSLTEMARLNQAGTLPANAIAITFDDGYACNALHAFPLLRKYGVPATIFLITGYVSSHEEFWWDALEKLVRETERQSLDLTLRETRTTFFLGQRSASIDDPTWNGFNPKTTRQAAYLTLWSKLRVLRYQERAATLADLHRQARISSTARQSHRILTEAEITKLVQSELVQIGAHSVTHPSFNELTFAEQKLEVEQSRDACFALTGRQPQAFAYPYGDYNNEAIESVRSARFKIACSAQPLSVAKLSDPLCLPRLQVTGWNVLKLIQAIQAVE